MAHNQLVVSTRNCLIADCLLSLRRHQLRECQLDELLVPVDGI